MKLVQANFSVRKERESSFHHRGGAVKHVQACLSAKKDGESKSSDSIDLMPGKI